MRILKRAESFCCEAPVLYEVGWRGNIQSIRYYCQGCDEPVKSGRDFARNEEEPEPAKV